MRFSEKILDLEISARAVECRPAPPSGRHSYPLAVDIWSLASVGWDPQNSPFVLETKLGESFDLRRAKSEQGRPARDPYEITLKLI
jgi:hypothetical protein